jgi:transcriptional regulator with XRE-family HTH domain
MALAELHGDRTQQDVAKRLGVSKAAITSWKQGMRPDPERVREAAEAYDADELELLRIAYIEDRPKPKPKKRAPRQAPNRPPL